MAGISFNKSQTYASSKTNSTSNRDVLYFPKDSCCIVMNGKEYGRSGGTQTVTSLSSLVPRSQSFNCNCSTNQTLTFSDTMQDGLTYNILIYNSSSSAVTVSLSSDNFGGVEIFLLGSFFGSSNGTKGTGAVLSVSAGRAILLRLTSMGSYMTAEVPY